MEELIRNGGCEYERNGKSNKEICTSTDRPSALFEERRHSCCKNK